MSSWIEASVPYGLTAGSLFQLNASLTTYLSSLYYDSLLHQQVKGTKQYLQVSTNMTDSSWSTLLIILPCYICSY